MKKDGGAGSNGNVPFFWWVGFGKIYRAVDAGTMTPTEGTRRGFMLDKLRASGLPDARSTSAGGVGTIINVQSAAEGQAFAPGNTVLLPYEEASRAWAAFNAGSQTWQLYLQEIEGQLTQAAFENLCRVVPRPAELPALAISAPVRVEIDAEPIVTFPHLVSESPDDGDHAA